LKATGFSGREYTWNLNKYDVYDNDKKKRSKYHLRARKLLKEIYHSYRILEEVKLPGSTASHRRSVLYLDFFIPNLRLGIEVHGQQHYEYSPFFHKNKAAFLKAQSRDEDKLKWCELNDIELVVLKYSDNEDDWRNTIKGV
jgi:very-short-patch-repair endonuclease